MRREEGGIEALKLDCVSGYPCWALQDSRERVPVFVDTQAIITTIVCIADHHCGCKGPGRPTRQPLYRGIFMCCPDFYVLVGIMSPFYFQLPLRLPVFFQFVRPAPQRVPVRWVRVGNPHYSHCFSSIFDNSRKNSGQELLQF